MKRGARVLIRNGYGSAGPDIVKAIVRHVFKDEFVALEWAHAIPHQPAVRRAKYGRALDGSSPRQQRFEHIERLADEGVTWCRGWTRGDSKAFRTTMALL